MELVILIGIQAAGKSSFFKERYADSHVRINRDMLRTKHRVRRLFDTCLELQQAAVLDQMNLLGRERRGWIRRAKDAGFRVVGFYFRSALEDSLARNAQRAEQQRVPERGIAGASSQLELPHPNEGYDELYYVRLAGDFDLQPWE